MNKSNPYQWSHHFFKARELNKVAYAMSNFDVVSLLLNLNPKNNSPITFFCMDTTGENWAMISWCALN
jgi:hypothetical protein